MKLLIALFSIIAPLDLDWSTVNKEIPKIKEYRYLYGAVQYDPVIYYGNEDIMGMESEIHLYFANRKISKAVLVLGPQGLNNTNCKQKFMEYINAMKKKYGKFALIKETSTSLEEDLFYTSECKLFTNGIKKIQVFWKLRKFHINATLLGDDDGLYIETVYTNKNLAKIHKKETNKKVYKKISKESKK